MQYLPSAGAGWFRRLIRITSAMAADTGRTVLHPHSFMLNVLPLPVNGAHFQPRRWLINVGNDAASLQGLLSDLLCPLHFSYMRIAWRIYVA